MTRRPTGALAALAALAMLPAVPLHAPAADGFLDAADAFRVSAHALGDKRIVLSYAIAPGYHLYRARLGFTSSDAALGEPRLPAARSERDPASGAPVETYRGKVDVVLPILAAGAASTLEASYQGCADRGLCYPPQRRAVSFALKAFGAPRDTAQVLPDEAAPVAAPAPVISAPPRAPEREDDGRLASALRGGRLAAVVPLFFAAGLLLSLTPCVLPMVPILSSIIVGQGAATRRWRGLTLALAYSLGMALVYTALGVSAGLAGEGLAARLQAPWVLASFAGLLALLSLSMFGLYELQLPAALRQSLSARGDRLRGGRHASVFAMGGLSALVVSPCVAAPLAAALLHISRTGDAVLGGLALFCRAMGMSVPLLLVGASAGALLPKAGAWMEQVRQVFGLLLMAMAIYTVQRVLPPLAAMACWGVLLLVGAASLGAFEPVQAARPGAARAVKGVGLVLALLGALEFVGMASGGRDFARPLSSLRSAAAPSGGAAAAEADGPSFVRVDSLADLERQLRETTRPVMLDFYADWCVSCKEMDSGTFRDPGVRAKLDKALLLRADVTRDSGDERALLRQFHLFGPPGLIFFDTQGRELESARVVGFQDVRRFDDSLARAGL